MSYQDAPTLRPQLRTLLAEALAERFAQETLDPAEAIVRPSAATLRRIAALERLVLPGSRVLDLGAGIGDLARAARRAGAELVDAVDADERMTELARLLCVAQDVDRVACFEGDAGLASTYADEYDAILAFGLLDRVAPILPRIAQNLRGVLVTEAPARGRVATALAAALPEREVLVAAEGEAPPLVACAADRAALRRHVVTKGSERKEVVA
jgi:2-polyprenyl-3-methyl-5-hydroxy-6-metoxy-1,4-benzoquinol methylase